MVLVLLSDEKPPWGNIWGIWGRDEGYKGREVWLFGVQGQRSVQDSSTYHEMRDAFDMSSTRSLLYWSYVSAITLLRARGPGSCVAVEYEVHDETPTLGSAALSRRPLPAQISTMVVPCYRVQSNFIISQHAVLDVHFVKDDSKAQSVNGSN